MGAGGTGNPCGIVQSQYASYPLGGGSLHCISVFPPSWL